MIIVAVVIIALAITAFVIFNKRTITSEGPVVPTGSQDAQQTLDSLAQDLTPEEKAASQDALNGLAHDLTPEEQAAAEATLQSLAQQ